MIEWYPIGWFRGFQDIISIVKLEFWDWSNVAYLKEVEYDCYATPGSWRVFRRKLYLDWNASSSHSCDTHLYSWAEKGTENTIEPELFDPESNVLIIRPSRLTQLNWSQKTANNQ